jgi:hypothetical protein
LLELKLLPEFLHLFDTLLGLGKYQETKKIFQFKDSSTRILFFSATNPESIESATALGAVLDEAGQNQFRRGTWACCRLSLSQGASCSAPPLQPRLVQNGGYDRWKAGIRILRSSSSHRY